MELLLLREEIVAHPFVLMELALGSLRNRRASLAELHKLDRVLVAGNSEVSRMIESHTLYSRGIGLVDVHLLASCLITPTTQLWTRDKRLASAARLLGCEASLP
jgi:hypothetical protein